MQHLVRSVENMNTRGRTCILLDESCLANGFVSKQKAFDGRKVDFVVEGIVVNVGGVDFVVDVFIVAFIDVVFVTVFNDINVVCVVVIETVVEVNVVFVDAVVVDVHDVGTFSRV